MTLVADQPYLLRDHTIFALADRVTEADDEYVIPVSQLPKEQKPREKLQKYGPKALGVAELVAVLLNVGTRKENVLSMAHRILKEYGESAIMSETDPAKLSEALNIPIGKAGQIIASFELGRRYFLNRQGKAIYVRSARQAHVYLKDMGSSQKEQLRGLYLNSRHEVIHDEVISIGSLTASIVHPREVFQPALVYGAVAIIIAHNHPSGSLEPTAADQLVTAQLIDAGRVLGIDLLDHLIITQDSFASIMEDVKHD